MIHTRQIMGIEIERKFLVRSEAWRGAVVKSCRLRQGYLAHGESATVRVRTDGHGAWLTIKTPGTGISRPEFEYRIPVDDAEQLLDACGTRVIEKVRHIVPLGHHQWEVDVFGGNNSGLVLAEIELSSERENFERPDWLGAEVSDDRRYDNASLALHPLSSQ
jgi:adenylate cyclase